MVKRIVANVILMMLLAGSIAAADGPISLDPGTGGSGYTGGGGCYCWLVP